MQIKLVSENKITQEQVEQVFNLPIAIGRDLSALPPNLNNEPVSPIVLLDNNRQISRFHAQIRLNNNRVYLEDQSSNGTKVNGKLLVKQGQVLNTGDTIVIGGYTITVVILEGGGQDEGTVIVGDAATVFNF
ncbi:FHA domain-containing protein, partial [Cylindrospermopsis raciborskii]